MDNLLLTYLISAIVMVGFSIMALPTLISRHINKKNEEKVRELETLLKQKQQV